MSVTLSASPINTLLGDYAKTSDKPFSAERGQQLWTQEFPHTKSGTLRSCSVCHTNELTRKGKHQRTQKIIDPLAPSVKPSRLSDVKKVKKWLKRNCKWTLGRECTPQEKGDLLTFIQSK
ncbi:MAG: DUF1924 domain-containing protein [Gammaproteobacteria bacterium]|nr:DUF1924 domain-containing protein [Gammaproteobacteria bacterium]